MRLWVRLAVLMAVASVLPLVLTSVRAIQVSTRTVERHAEGLLGREAAELATFVSTWTGDQAAALRGWMQLYPDLADKDPAQQEALLRSIYVAMPSVVTLALVDDEGAEVVPPVYLSRPPEDGTLAGRIPSSDAAADLLVDHLPLSEAVLASREGGATGRSASVQVVGTAYPVDGRIAVPVAVTGPSDPSLVLGAELVLDPVATHLGVRRDVPGQGVAVVTRNGTPVLGGDDPLVDGMLLKPLLGTSSTFRYVLDDGTRVRGAVAPVAGTDWDVIVVEPAHEAERAAAEIRNQTLGVVVVSLLLAVAVGVVLARSVSEPVWRLRDSALAVARGEVGRRVRLDRADEIGELAQAFDHMSEALEQNARDIAAQQAEIEDFNRELQARVEARTAELRDAQQRLVQSGQLAAVAEVGAGLAHELNNPLTGILGTAQLLRVQLEGTPEGDRVRRIEEEAARCREVLQAMLRFSSGEVDPSDAPVVDLGPLLREVVSLVRGPFRHRGVDLHVEEPISSSRVRIDPVLGSRVLAQVLNALRAGLPSGARLGVSVRVSDGEVAVVLVPDRPVAVGASRDDWMASGMGLWVARQLLDDLGGRLEAPAAPETRWRLVLPEAA